MSNPRFLKTMFGEWVKRFCSKKHADGQEKQTLVQRREATAKAVSDWVISQIRKGGDHSAKLAPWTEEMAKLITSRKLTEKVKEMMELFEKGAPMPEKYHSLNELIPKCLEQRDASTQKAKKDKEKAERHQSAKAVISLVLKGAGDGASGSGRPGVAGANALLADRTSQPEPAPTGNNPAFNGLGVAGTIMIQSSWCCF